MSNSIRYPLHHANASPVADKCMSPMMLPEQVRKTGAGKLYCIRCAALVDVTPEQRGQAERAALADGFDVLAHRAPVPVVAPPPSPPPCLAMPVPMEPRRRYRHQAGHVRSCGCGGFGAHRKTCPKSGMAEMVITERTPANGTRPCGCGKFGPPRKGCTTPHVRKAVLRG